MEVCISWAKAKLVVSDEMIIKIVILHVSTISYEAVKVRLSLLPKRKLEGSFKAVGHVDFEPELMLSTFSVNFCKLLIAVKQ